MNIVRELRKKKGIQQKELAIAIGVSCPTVSAWEMNKKDPSGERLKKLANYFGVDELVILGKGTFVPDKPGLFVPIRPEISGKSETEQIFEMLMERLDNQPKTPEARILATGIDKLPKEQREQALDIMRAVFISHADYFKLKGNEEDES